MEGVSFSQCVVFGDEILILGGNDRGSCYSYHTIKKGYRFITLYPERAATQGHIVVRYDKILHNQLNPESENGLEMVLLSIGGKREIRPSHTLVMKYHSVWDDTNTKINANTNEWVSLTEEKTNELIKFKEYLASARGCLSGKNGNLLIVSVNKTIDVINLDTCQYLSTISNLPRYFFWHCMIPLPHDNDININHFFFILLDCCLLVKYDESNNVVEHEELPVITSLSTFLGYGYVRIDDRIVLVGGTTSLSDIRGNDVYIFSLKDRTWMKSEYPLSLELAGCCLVSTNNSTISIIGGQYKSLENQPVHYTIDTDLLLSQE
ncbi:hypothetical protein RFI_01888 [Reticulomyxa filosa]|uniref:Kelch motif family protein n=1 Tax=Reticulomyxa filosa TaxID=46433 RepID=X6PBZ4_RETFI|nr:hypothetical protein RFI_01888 [Reticulomyxa filosa]|eukprot:ETO35187.1 hypothetical protein RFI_01888 [Reticulomyxa filosa]